MPGLARKTPPPRPKFEVRGAGEVQKRLTDVRLRAAQGKAATPALRAVFQDAHLHRFSSDADGQWPALRDTTLERKARDGTQNQGVLRATDRLYRSLTASMTSDQYITTRAGLIEFGTDVPYAQYHMKRRPPIGLREEDVRNIRQVLSSYIATGTTTSRRAL